jgi:hypothetical protein
VVRPNPTNKNTTVSHQPADVHGATRPKVAMLFTLKAIPSKQMSTTAAVCMLRPSLIGPSNISRMNSVERAPWKVMQWIQPI